MDLQIKDALSLVFDQIDKIKFLEDHPHLAVCITNKENLIIWVNNSFCRLLEYSQDELFNQPFDMIRGHSSRLVDYQLEKLKEELVSAEIKLQVVTKTGREFLINGQISLLPSETKYYFYEFSFYSERVKSLLQSMQNCYKLLTGNSGTLFITVAAIHPYKVQLITQNSFLEIGQDFETIQGQSILRFIVLEDAKKIKQAFLLLLENKSDDLEILEVNWKNTDNNKLLKVMVQLDRTENCFYIIAAPLSSKSSIEQSEQVLQELKEISLLPEKALSKIERLEENLKHQKDVDDFYGKQMAALFQQVKQLSDQSNTLSSQMSVIYSETIEVIQNYKKQKKIKRVRIEKLKGQLIYFFSSPFFLPLACLSMLLILQVVIVLLPELGFLSVVEEKIVNFLLRLFEQ